MTENKCFQCNQPSSLVRRWRLPFAKHRLVWPMLAPSTFIHLQVMSYRWHFRVVPGGPESGGQVHNFLCTRVQSPACSPMGPEAALIFTCTNILPLELQGHLCPPALPAGLACGSPRAQHVILSTDLHSFQLGLQVNWVSCIFSSCFGLPAPSDPLAILPSFHLSAGRPPSRPSFRRARCWLCGMDAHLSPVCSLPAPHGLCSLCLL